jgi:hypothetical protein
VSFNAGGELLKGKVVVIGPGTIHAISDIGKSGLVIFIDWRRTIVFYR